eukprot:13839102-Alexandrium_andersonii.AAC.1
MCWGLLPPSLVSSRPSLGGLLVRSARPMAPDARAWSRTPSASARVWGTRGPDCEQPLNVAQLQCSCTTA